MRVEPYIIKKNKSILDGMEQLARLKGSARILFVVEEDKLVGALTDGDIRRCLISGGDLQSPVFDAANHNPVFLHLEDRVSAEQLIREQYLDAIPILADDKSIIDIVLREQNDEMIEAQTISLPVVIMAGGKGTRLYPYTKILPKPLIPINDVPILERVMDRFFVAGCKDFYIIVNHKKNMIKSYFSDQQHPYHIHYVDEDIPLGTGGGVSLLKGIISSTFVLSNCDTLIHEDFSAICKYHQSSGNAITIICSAKQSRISYGVVKFGENGALKRMDEKPTMSYFANTGCYIVEPSVISEIGENEEIGFTDVIDRCMKLGYRIGAFPISEYAWMDMGQLEELNAMKERLELE